MLRKRSEAGVTDEDLDYDEDVDEEDFNEKQEFKRTTFPFPSMPFSTSNRTQSASVYVIYTYDVLNIFMYIYTANTSSLDIPMIGKAHGVLIDFMIQIIHVLLIGIKFYPILIVADMDPYAIVYLTASVYMGIIWTLKLFTKGFCSRTEAFVKRTLKKLSTEVKTKFKDNIGGKYNVSNTLLGLFSDDPNPNEKYLKALKVGIPSVFREFFGKYDEPNSEPLLLGGGSEDLVLLEDNSLGYPASNRYYADDFTEITTTSTLSTTLSYGFRDRMRNETMSRAKTFMEMFSERNMGHDMLINILENLPLYLTLSFLLSRYIVLFLGCVVDGIKERCMSSASDLDETEIYFENYINKDESEQPKDPEEIVAGIDNYLKKLDYKQENQLTSQIENHVNHNYKYINNLVKNIRFFDYKFHTDHKSSDRPRRIFSTQQVSYVWHLIETYLYKNVPYMKYSKQFINTYTVAFMVIYFFTLFGFRLSNLFGNTIVVSIEMVYRFIFRGMIPTFSFNDHNFNAEFRFTCMATSFVIALQLLLSIKNFHIDLLKLHKGEKLISNLVLKHRDMEKIKRVRNKMSSTITSDSLHFPGYLIAHLVYGYGLLFIVFFSFTILVKLLYYFPKVLQTSSQIILPLVILVSLKLIVIQLATKIIFLREDGQRITNLAPYYTISYFNFFFDCFLGLVACMSRIWQTTVVSLFTLPRLDKSMFNKDSDIIMRRLDKGHLAYINYVRMEHWYNNPVSIF